MAKLSWWQRILNLIRSNEGIARSLAQQLLPALLSLYSGIPTGDAADRRAWAEAQAERLLLQRFPQYGGLVKLVVPFLVDAFERAIYGHQDSGE